MSAKNFMSPYVQAYASLSIDNKGFALGVGEFENFHAAVQSDVQLKDFLCSPAIQLSVKETLVRKSLKTLGVQELTTKVLVLMIRKNAIAHLGQFVALLRTHADERLDILRGQVRTAIELDQDDREKITKLLADLTSKNLEMQYDVDSTLIGGVRVKMRDIDMDATILRKLENAKMALSNKRA